MALTDAYRTGAMAKYVSTEADCVLPMRDGFSYEDAATLRQSGQTAWRALVRYSEFGRSQRLLVHRGAGAVGTFAIQIASWIDANVAVAASAVDEPVCRGLGADGFIGYRGKRFEDPGGNCDPVLEEIGGNVQENSSGILKLGGRVITIASEKTEASDRERARAAMAFDRSDRFAGKPISIGSERRLPTTFHTENAKVVTETTGAFSSAKHAFQTSMPRRSVAVTAPRSPTTRNPSNQTAPSLLPQKS